MFSRRGNAQLWAIIWRFWLRGLMLGLCCSCGIVRFGAPQRNPLPIILFADPSNATLHASNTSTVIVEYRDAEIVTLNSLMIQILTISGNATCAFSVETIRPFLSQITLSNCSGSGHVQIKISTGSATSKTQRLAGEAYSQVIEVAAAVSVVASYPLNGLDWNDFVANDGATPYTATDTACTGAEAGNYRTACVHGGEKKSVEVTGLSSCAGLTAEDSLDAFDWECLVVSGTATFYSKGLKWEKNLSDLVNATSWKTNYISIYQDSSLIRQSSAAEWWSNPVQAAGTDNANTVTLATASTIYTLSGTLTTEQYEITADKISLVGLSGSTLTSTTHPMDPFIHVNGVDFVYIEGNFVDAFGSNMGSNAGVYNNGGAFLRLRNVKLKGMNFAGSATSKKSILEKYYCDGVDFSTVPGNCVVLATGSSDYLLDSLRITRTHRCIESDSDNLVAHSVHCYNTNGAGTGGTDWSIAGDDISLTEILFSNSSGNNITSSANMSLLGFTSYNNGFWPSQGQGIQVSANTTLYQILGYNVFYDLVTLNGSNNKLGQIAAESRYAVVTNASSNNVVTDYVLIDPGTSCSVTGGVAPGIDNSCNAADASTHSTDNTLDLSASFKERIAVTDTSNGSNTLGTQTFNTLTDWFNFENFFRSWGRNQAYVGGAATHCGAGETCAIWDTRLLATGTAVFNRSEDGQNPNGAFVVGDPCPSAVDGNASVTDNAGRIFLKNAYESMHDGNGNENGLCESNENCIYMPNIGAYQGYGDLEGTCTFSDGTVSGVNMYRYENNGI